MFSDMSLRIYQVVSVHAMSKLLGTKHHSAVLADNVGTGKTITTLALMCYTN